MLLRKQAVGAKKSKPSKNKENQNQEKIIISMDTESMGQITVIIMIPVSYTHLRAHET